MSFWTYILRLSNGQYYTGHTDNLDVRLAQHQRGELKGYTSRHLPVELMWSEEFPTRDEAFEAEWRVGGWSRAKKEALFSGDWKKVSHFAKPPARRVSRHAVSTSSTAARDERSSFSPGPSLPAHLEPASSEVEMRRRETAPAIVLVRPQLGENIGKAARAMLNFGLTDLRLVTPRDGWPNPSAGPAASGADIVLERAQVFDSVAEAVADCPDVYATTVRKRGLVVPVATPEQAALAIRSSPRRAAVLFGAERSGLETEEAAIAGTIITVPINPEFRSLNLAQAVILIAYEWSKHEALAMPTIGEEVEPRAPHAHLEGLIGQLDEALEAAGYFFPPDRTPATRNTIRTILTKADWSTREIQALRGMIRTITNPRQRGQKPPQG
jgi:tRNA/rRNA methyltransferase